MHNSPYLASAFNRSDALGWFVLRTGEGRLVAQSMSKTQAITLASVLNFTADALRTAWWEARNQPPQQRP